MYAEDLTILYLNYWCRGGDLNTEHRFGNSRDNNELHDLPESDLTKIRQGKPQYIVVDTCVSSRINHSDICQNIPNNNQEFKAKVVDAVLAISKLPLSDEEKADMIRLLMKD